jgi:hypothetical protein
MGGVRLWGALALGALAGAPAAARGQFGPNLILNPGADAAPAGDGAVVPIPGWTQVGNFTAVSYGAAGGFPTAASPGPAARGAGFFAGGPGASSSASQLISLTAFAGLDAVVDAGNAAFDFGGFLGGFSTQGDHMTLAATFLDAGAGTIGSSLLGPVTDADRGNVTGLLRRSTSGVLPAGTRAVQIMLLATRSNGSYNDGYADELSFTLTSTAAAVPEPATVSLLGLGVLALGGVAARRRRTASP